MNTSRLWPLCAALIFALTFAALTLPAPAQTLPAQTLPTPTPAPPTPAPSVTAGADALFQAGSFDAAETAYTQALTTDPKNFRALVRLGSLALLSNRLDAAQARLTAAIAAQPGSKVPHRLLAEVYRRQDRFAQAEPELRLAGEAPQADQLASFGTDTPYELPPAMETVTVPFALTDPLPLVEVKVEGHAPVLFWIDTGGSEVYLDSDYAREIGVKTLSGDPATQGFGKVQSVTLGGLTVRSLPVSLLPVRAVGPIFGGRRIDGVLGTEFLYHFLATIDYPHKQLVLRPRATPFPAPTPRGTVAPFWSVPFRLAGDHCLIASGALNGGASQLFLVDTGLAGGGFSAPQSTLDAAGITLDPAPPASVGAGTPVPFPVKTLALGPVVRHDIQGQFTGPFPLENAFGFHIGGLVSHGFFRPYRLTLDFTRMRLILN